MSRSEDNFCHFSDYEEYYYCNPTRKKNCFVRNFRLIADFGLCQSHSMMRQQSRPMRARACSQQVISECSQSLLMARGWISSGSGCAIRSQFYRPLPDTADARWLHGMISSSWPVAPLRCCMPTMIVPIFHIVKFCRNSDTRIDGTAGRDSVVNAASKGRFSCSTYRMH